MKKAVVVEASKRPTDPCPKCKVGAMSATMIADAQSHVIWQEPSTHEQAYLGSS